MTEIRKIKGGRVVQYENLPDMVKNLVDGYYRDAEFQKQSKRESKGASHSDYHEKQRMAELNAALLKLKMSRWWALTEQDELGKRGKLRGYDSKEEAVRGTERMSSDSAKETRHAIRTEKLKITEELIEEETKELYEELADSGLIRDKSLIVFLSTYLEEGESYGTGEAGDKPYRERREDLEFYINIAFDMAKTSISKGECFGRNVLDKHGEVVEFADGKQSGARDNHKRQLKNLGMMIQNNLCPDERKSNTDQQLLNALDDIMGELKQADPDEVFDRAPKPPEDMHDRRPKNPQVAKSWWDTLKIAGPVNTGNPGTKAMFNNKAINPPKKKPKKEKKPKTYPIVPEDKDFWRD